MVLHLGLGFGINEVYIMSPHWLFVLPLAMAFMLLRARGAVLMALRGVLLLLIVYMAAHNGVFLADFLLQPAA